MKQEESMGLLQFENQELAHVHVADMLRST
jgi:hypothetical protein